MAEKNSFIVSIKLNIADLLKGKESAKKALKELDGEKISASLDISDVKSGVKAAEKAIQGVDDGNAKLKADGEQAKKEAREVAEEIGNIPDEKETKLNLSGNLLQTISGMGVGMMVANFVTQIAGEIKEGFGTYTKAMNTLDSRINVSEENIGEYQEALKNVFKAHGTEDEVVEAFGKVQTTLKTSAEDTGRVTEKLISLTKTFDEVDTNEAIGAVDNLSKSFGITHDAALDLIAVTNKKLGIKADMDTFKEYSAHLKELGMDAADLNEIIKKTGDSDAYNLDYVLDMYKEFNIRIKDNSQASQDAIMALFGEQAGEELFAGLRSGSITGKEAMNQIRSGLVGMDDKLKQSEIAVALFGTKFEDLGTSTALTVTDIAGATEDFAGAADEINKKLAEAEKFNTFINNVKTFFFELGEKAVPVINTIVDGFISLFTTIEENIDITAGLAGTIGAYAIAANAAAIKTAIVTGATKLLTLAQWALNVAMSANPVGLIVAGVVALASAIYIVVKRAGSWAGAWEYLKAAMLVSWEYLKAYVGFIMNVSGLILEYLTFPYKALWGVVKDTFNNITELIDAVVSGDFDTAAKILAKSIADNFSKAFNDLANKFHNTTNSFDGLGEKTAQIWADAGKKADELAGKVEETAGEQENLTEATEETGEAIETNITLTEEQKKAIKDARAEWEKFKSGYADTKLDKVQKVNIEFTTRKEQLATAFGEDTEQYKQEFAILLKWRKDQINAIAGDSNTAFLSAERQYYEAVRFEDETYYNWKKGKIEEEKQLKLALYTAEQQALVDIGELSAEIMQQNINRYRAILDGIAGVETDNLDAGKADFDNSAVEQEKSEIEGLNNAKLELQQLELDEFGNTHDEKMAYIDAERDYTINAENAKYEVLKANLESQYKDKKLLDERLQIEEQIHQKKINLINKKSQMAKDDINKAELMSTVDMLDQTAQAFAGKSKGMFRLAQTIGVAKAIMNVYEGITAALKLTFPLNIAQVAMVTATGFAAVDKIAAQKYRLGGWLFGKRHEEGGIPIEAEGGEYIINKRTSFALGKDFLDFINFSPVQTVKNFFAGLNIPKTLSISMPAGMYGAGGSVITSIPTNSGDTAAIINRLERIESAVYKQTTSVEINNNIKAEISGEDVGVVMSENSEVETKRAIV